MTGCEKCDGDGILNVSWSLDGTSDDFVRQVARAAESATEETP